MSRLKTNTEFLEDLYRINDSYRAGNFTVLDEYKNAITKIRVQTEFGTCQISPNALLANKNPCTSQSAMDKNEYIKNLLLKHNKSYFEGFFKIKSDFKGWHKKMTVETIYGECSLTLASLYSGSKPGIDSAINKKDYWISYAKSKNRKSKDYSFDKTELNSTSDMVIITCNFHGDFEIKASNFTSKEQGCQECFNSTRVDLYQFNGGWGIKDWWKKGEKSKRYDCFKMYIIRCWDEYEEFYKIGRTFLKVEERFNGTAIPYNYEIVEERKSHDGLKIYCLEKAFLRENSKNKYKPTKDFNGKQECFTKIIDINNGKKIG